jgi:hypothetical protein
LNNICKSKELQPEIPRPLKIYLLSGKQHTKIVSTGNKTATQLNTPYLIYSTDAASPVPNVGRFIGWKNGKHLPALNSHFFQPVAPMAK